MGQPIPTTPIRKLLKWVMAILSVGVFVALCALGNWQVQRLHWKETLLAQIEERMSAAPITINAMADLSQSGENIDYRSVILTGTYDHSKEVFYYNTNDGVVGWNVFTPLKTDEGKIVMVNRGFIPDRFKQAKTRMQGQLIGTQTIEGLGRIPQDGKPNSFMPENDIAANIFFWKDHAAMAAKMGLGLDEVYPFFVDAGKNSIPGGYPQGGTTRISFPNSHLQYAITWYGLAVALVLVSGVYFWTNRRRKLQSDA